MVRCIRLNLKKKFAVAPNPEDVVKISLRVAGEADRHMAVFNRTDNVRVGTSGIHTGVSKDKKKGLQHVHFS